MTYQNAYTYIAVQACKYIQSRARTHTHIIYIFTHIYIYIYTCIDIYIYIYHICTDTYFLIPFPGRHVGHVGHVRPLRGNRNGTGATTTTIAVTLDNLKPPKVKIQSLKILEVSVCEIRGDHTLNIYIQIPTTSNQPSQIGRTSGSNKCRLCRSHLHCLTFDIVRH